MLPPRAAGSRRPLRRRRVPAAVALAAAIGLAPAAPSLAAGTASEPVPRALVVVRTLVMDALGTRTVDTDRARIPYGSRGLLIKRVPYAGPPLAFRLAVLAGPPQESGIPLTMTAEVWGGEPDAPPPPEQVSRREEATVLSAEGSYLLELDHDPQAGRRIVLSLTARPAGPNDEEIPFTLPPAGSPIRFVLEVMRESGGRFDPPDHRVLSSLVGQPITYSSEVRHPPLPGEGGDQPERMTGLSITLEAEQAQGNLVSVRLVLSGAEFTDPLRTRLEPFRHEAIHTVPSGTAFDVSLSVPSGAAPGPGAVRYQVRVTPLLEP